MLPRQNCSRTISLSLQFDVVVFVKLFRSPCTASFVSIPSTPKFGKTNPIRVTDLSVITVKD